MPVPRPNRACCPGGRQRASAPGCSKCPGVPLRVQFRPGQRVEHGACGGAQWRRVRGQSGTAETNNLLASSTGRRERRQGKTTPATNRSKKRSIAASCRSLIGAPIRPSAALCRTRLSQARPAAPALSIAACLLHRGHQQHPGALADCLSIPPAPWAALVDSDTANMNVLARLRNYYSGDAGTPSPLPT